MAPDLVPSDYSPFIYLKNWLGSQSFNNNEELMEGIETYVAELTGDRLLWQRYRESYSPIQVSQFRR
jgi:hypothetical protein